MQVAAVLMWIGLSLGLAGATAAASWEDALKRGRMAADRAQVEEAERTLRAALETARDDAERPWGVPMVLYHLGDFYFTFPFADGAEEAGIVLSESAGRWETLAGPESPALVIVLSRLGWVQQDAGQNDAGKASLARAEAILRKLVPENHAVFESWPTSSEALRPDDFFRPTVETIRQRGRRAAASAPGEPSDGASPAPRACTPAPAEPAVVDPGDTYLRASTEREGKPVFIHVTEDDMPWVVAIGKPKRAPRYGSRADAQRVAIEAMQEWEQAIQPHVPWFRLEFVEKDDDAAVQVKWKRRITGPWAGFGKQRWWTVNGCLRVGGEMQVSTEPGNFSHLKLAEVKLLIAHEFGHVLGLGHCLDCESAMNYDWQTRERIFVTELDVRTFVKLLSIPNGAVGIGAPKPEGGPDS